MDNVFTNNLLMVVLAGLIFGLSRVPKIGIGVFSILSFAWPGIIGMIAEGVNARGMDIVILFPFAQSVIMVGFVVCFLQLGKGYSFKVDRSAKDDPDDMEDV